MNPSADQQEGALSQEASQAVPTRNNNGSKALSSLLAIVALVAGVYAMYAPTSQRIGRIEIEQKECREWRALHDKQELPLIAVQSREVEHLKETIEVLRKRVEELRP